MERRVSKVSIGFAGGTASKGSKTCKIALPTSWIKAMGITEDDRGVELSFDGTRITLSRPLNDLDFAKQHQLMGHDIRIFRFYDGTTLCSTIYADFDEQSLVVKNEDVLLVKTAFGNNKRPDWKDFQDFLSERCIPRERAGLREYLEAWGLEEYDPISIIQKTEGRMAEDQQWLTIEVLK